MSRATALRASRRGLSSSRIQNSHISDDQKAVSRSGHLEKSSHLTSQSPYPEGSHGRPKELFSVRGRLQRWTAANAATLREQADSFSSAAAARLAQLGGRLNHITGYEEIEALKRRVVENETRISDARRAAWEAKTAYEEAVTRMSTSQRAVNDLLQRKSTWKDEDVSRFTQLVLQDHTFEQAESRAKVDVAMAENAVEREFDELLRSILARYHEEQVWSDKIRSVSTYGSLAALGLNLVVFILAIIVVEPWRRRQLVQTFEQRVLDMTAQNQAVVEEGMQDLAHHLATLENVVVEVSQAARTPLIPVDQLDGALATTVGKDGPAVDAGATANIVAGHTLTAITVSGVVGAGVLGWFLGIWYG